MGFKNITPNNDYLSHPEDANMGSVCVNKHIYIKDTYGNITKYNLIVTAMRSANYEKEWTFNDGNWYLFDNMQNADVGKMVVGWREIDGIWYYFDTNGVYLTQI